MNELSGLSVELRALSGHRCLFPRFGELLQKYMAAYPSEDSGMEPLADETGPHTTNHSQGWHNGLRHQFQHSPHPRFSFFLVRLLEMRYATFLEIRRVQRGKVLRPANEEVIRNNAQIDLAKAELNVWLQTLYANFPADNVPILVDRVIQYLDSRCGATFAWSALVL